MSYLKDPAAVSLIWGRIGAAVCGLAALGLGIWGYTFTPEDQEQMTTLISSLLAGLGGVLALVSKIRESKKVTPDE